MNYSLYESIVVRHIKNQHYYKIAAQNKKDADSVTKKLADEVLKVLLDQEISVYMNEERMAAVLKFGRFRNSVTLKRNKNDESTKLFIEKRCKREKELFGINEESGYRPTYFSIHSNFRVLSHYGKCILIGKKLRDLLESDCTISASQCFGGYHCEPFPISDIELMIYSVSNEEKERFLEHKRFNTIGCHEIVELQFHGDKQIRGTFTKCTISLSIFEDNKDRLRELGLSLFGLFKD